MVAGLSGALIDKGHEITVITPLYRGIKQNYPKIKPTRYSLRIPMGRRIVNGRVQKLCPRKNLTILFVEQPKYFDRKGIYTENGTGYADNAERYIFFSKAVTELSNKLRKRPNIIHCHDWQAGLVPLLLKHRQKLGSRILRFRTCMTIHNLAYQGICTADNFTLTNLPKKYFSASGMEFYGQMNFMKAGLVYSDQLTTVSPRYATEILTPESGEGLDGVLQQRTHDLSGILNGVDYTEWRTTGNPHLPFEYSEHDLSGKYKNKTALIRDLEFQSTKNASLLYAYVGRLADQKGISILLEALPKWLRNSNSIIAILGSGEKWMERNFVELQNEFTNRIYCHIGYNEKLAHRIEAAADFFLMPSKFEPCGLNQLYSLRYGTIPIVNDVGGLSDSIIDLRLNQNNGNGFKLSEYSSDCLIRTIRASAKYSENKDKMRRIRKRAMRANFNWGKSAKHYLDIFNSI